MFRLNSRQENNDATAEMKATHQVNLTQRLDAAYEEAKRLVEELHSGADKKAKPRARQLKGRKNKP